MNNNNNNYTHQDWTPVTTKKTEVNKKTFNINPEYKKMKELDDNTGEPISVKKIDKSEIAIIKQLRINKKLSQTQVNNALSLQKDTIKNIENGTHVKNKQLFRKINNYLEKYQIISD